MYWRSVFPNTPMPKTLRNLLIPAAGSEIKNMLVDMANKDDDTDASKNKLKYDQPSKEFADGNVPTNNDLYFFESELHPGRKMNLKDLTKKPSKAAFLPPSIAESIPFSTKNFSEILKYFSLKAKSAEAKLLKQTVEICEKATMEGEDKYCVRTLESLVDSGVSKLGTNIRLLSNDFEKETQKQDLTICQGVKMMGESNIVCHKLEYAYAVFLCHSIDKTTVSVYTVPLIGTDGTRARGLAVCHKNTSTWNPKHLAFQILKVKLGTVSVCHFLDREALVWVRI